MGYQKRMVRDRILVSGLDSAATTPYKQRTSYSAATGPGKTGHARPVFASSYTGPFHEERGQNAQDED